jgi:uncharacterized SAM-binding protein YcdF (DUF218 family)
MMTPRRAMVTATDFGVALLLLAAGSWWLEMWAFAVIVALLGTFILGHVCYLIVAPRLSRWTTRRR